MRFTHNAINTAAELLGVMPEVIRAVAEVEAAGDGFLVAPKDGKPGIPKILFEAHIFGRLTGGQYNVTHPQISSAKWNRALYRGGRGEWARLESARRLSPSFADQSASWGAFQILGSNFRECGFKSVGDFVKAMCESEDRHLLAFVAFVQHNNAMHLALKSQDWAGFAKRYNGPGYKANQYDVKIAAAFARQMALAQSDPHAKADAKAAQAALNAKGHKLTVDGYAGPKTREAVAKHQEAAQDISVTGGLDDKTRESLGLPVEKVITKVQGVAGAVGAAAASVSPLMGLDWRVAAVLGGVALLAGAGYLIHRYLKIKEARA